MADIKGLLNKYANVPGERFFGDVFNNKEYKATLKIKTDVVIDVVALAGELVLTFTIMLKLFMH